MSQPVPALALLAPIVLAALAGCSGDEGPNPFISVNEDGIALHSTYGNYPPGYPPFGHVTLLHDDLPVIDRSKGRSEGFRVHQLTDTDEWQHIKTYRFDWRLPITPLKVSFLEAGNYSLSDLERGGPGRGVHQNVTVLTHRQGCDQVRPSEWECDWFDEASVG